MAGSNVSSVVNYFANANEGFATTLGSTITSGAATVPLASVTGLTNGTIFVGIIEPGATNQQVFTGTVDTGGAQITGVVWTRGTNVGHAGGVSIVDYVTGTAFNMLSAGFLKQHTQTGAHGAITATSINNAGVLTQTGLATFTAGTNLPAGDIGTADLAAASVTPTKLGTGAAQAFVATSETTASTTYADLATVTDTVTVTIGSNGLALVSIFSHLQLATASGESAFVGFAISGASTVAAGDTQALRYQTWTAAAFGQYGATFLVTGLTPGSTTFKMKYRASSNTATFLNRRIAVVPL